MPDSSSPTAGPIWPQVFAAKAQQGTKYRFLFGDPDSEVVHQRCDEEGIGDGLAARIRLSMRYLGDLLDVPGVEMRQHRTILYNSLFRFDEDLLVNTHVLGGPLFRR